MYDELQKRGDKFEHKVLGEMIGIPFIPTISNRGIGIKDLYKKIIDVYEDKDSTVRQIQINFGFAQMGEVL